jgi:hypothetical protein
MMRAGVYLIGLVMALPCAAMAAPASVPLPPPKPPEIAHPSPSPPAPAPKAKEGANEEEAPEGPKEPTAGELCLERLKQAGFVFDTAASPHSSNSACIIDTPVHLKAVATARRGTVRLTDEPLLSCRFSESFGHWVADLAAPLIAELLGSEVKAVRTGPGYECRNRNRAAGGKLSAHALGLAIDVGAFELANGKSVPIKPNGDERMHAAVEVVRTAACGWFLTVLGPGSDAAHTDHMHLDIQQHGSSDRYRICQ